jgi:hypothetical protein
VVPHERRGRGGEAAALPFGVVVLRQLPRSGQNLDEVNQPSKSEPIFGCATLIERDRLLAARATQPQRANRRTMDLSVAAAFTVQAVCEHPIEVRIIERAGKNAGSLPLDSSFDDSICVAASDAETWMFVLRASDLIADAL